MKLVKLLSLLSFFFISTTQAKTYMKEHQIQLSISSAVEHLKNHLDHETYLVFSKVDETSKILTFMSDYARLNSDADMKSCVVRIISRTFGTEADYDSEEGASIRAVAYNFVSSYKNGTDVQKGVLTVGLKHHALYERSDFKFNPAEEWRYLTAHVICNLRQ